MSNIKKITISIIAIMLILASFSIVKANSGSEIGVAYNTHVQDIGWEKDFSKKNGEVSGTQGLCKRLEGIKIKGTNLPKGASIQYQVHVQNIGWQGWKQDGAMAGTQGKCLRLEGIKLKLVNMPNYSIEYRVHVQNVGWQAWKQDGAMAGTQGKCLRLEAIQIRIVKKQNKGAINVETNLNQAFYNTIAVSGWKMSNVAGTKLKVLLDDKDVTAQANVQYRKRTDLAEKISYGSDVENATPGFYFAIGTSNLTAGAHKLAIQLVTSDGKTVLATYAKNINIDKSIHISYRSHVQMIGWQGYVSDGASSGTTGQCKRIEAMKIKAYNLPNGVTLKYQAHIQDKGWSNWVGNDQAVGITGQNKRLEAIKIKLENTNQYSVMYRAHVQDYGWQGWAYDGEMSGTVGSCKRVEAIQIKVVNKITEQKTIVNLDLSGSVTNQVHSVTGWCMTNVKNTRLQLLIDNKVVATNFQRSRDQNVYNTVKGYGGEELNPAPRFAVNVDFSKYSLGNHTVAIQAISSDGKLLSQSVKTINVRNKIEISTGTYGISGLKAKGDSRGSNLTYYKYGSGPNVFFATFSVHGFEDKWAKDGTELTVIANKFWETLKASNDYNLASKWTIYIFPEVNPDGRRAGWTNNGPGRTTLFSNAPGNKGIDLNRCWSAGFKYQSNNRNYTGTQAFQAYEARYLRDFLLSHKSKNGQTLLVDLHGWTQQLIGDAGISNYYKQQFPQNAYTSSYGSGYLINWARTSLGSTSRAARAALIELPSNINNPSDVTRYNIQNKYISATLSMLRGIN